MAVYRSYGTSSHTADEVARILGDHLGLIFAERDSSYLGTYYLARRGDSRIAIQPNAIPGDDGDDDLYDPEHPAIRVLVLISTPSFDPSLEHLLGSVDWLTDLGKPTSGDVV